MSETISSRECGIVGGQGVEIRVESREENILRSLGVVHLDNKVARPRFGRDETDAMILKEAGVSYVNINASEYDDEGGNSRNKRKETKKKRGTKDEMTIKPLSRAEAEILRRAGVAWLEDMAVIYDDDTYCHKLGCNTSATAERTVGTNNTYAERELARRLKEGWTSTGEECEECGMPVICKSKGDLLECVICGVVGGEDNFDPALLEEGNYHDSPDLVDGENSAVPRTVEGNHDGVFNVGTNVSTITPSLAPSEGFGTEYRCQECHQAVLDEEDVVMGEDRCVQCRAVVEKEEPVGEDDMDAVYNEALGRRLFDGWELSKYNCENCNLPLISEFEGAPSICLRCG